MGLYDAIEQFKLYHSYMADKIVDYVSINQDEILIMFVDGSKGIFDVGTHVFKAVPADPENMTDKETARYFSQRLQKWMNIRGVNQKELSYRTGIAQSTISRYLTCHSIPTFTQVDKIARALRCSVDDFRFI